MRLALRVILAAVWLLAAIAKVSALDELSTMIKMLFPIIGGASLGLAIMLVVIEGFIGICLLLPRMWDFGARLSTFAAMVFLAVNLIRYQARIGVPCSCFGILYKTGPVPMVTFDAVLLAASAALLRTGGKDIEERNLVAL